MGPRCLRLVVPRRTHDLVRAASQVEILRVLTLHNVVTEFVLFLTLRRGFQLDWFDCFTDGW